MQYPMLIDVTLGQSRFWTCMVDGRNYTCSYGIIGRRPHTSTTIYKDETQASDHAGSAYGKSKSLGFVEINEKELKRLLKLVETMGVEYKVEFVVLVGRSDGGDGHKVLAEIEPSGACNPSINPWILVMITNILTDVKKLPFWLLIDDEIAWMAHGLKQIHSQFLPNKENHGILWPPEYAKILDRRFIHLWEYNRLGAINSREMLDLVVRVRQAIAEML